jgi:dipeptidyl aminopeptidase/acylaminoacyl peptidase
MIPLRRSLLAGLALVATLPAPAQAALSYQQPPAVIRDLVDVANPPTALIDPHARILALVQRPTLLELRDLARPEARLAGLRIQPLTHNQARTRPLHGLSLKSLVTGQELALTGLPEPLRFEYPAFSPDGRQLAFAEIQATGMALWTVDTATGQARRRTGPVLSAVLGRPYVWAADGLSIYAKVRPTLAPGPEADPLPLGPAVQDATGVRAPSRTYPDLLRTPADEARFAFYATTEIQRLDLAGGSASILPPALYQTVLPAPGGDYLLVEELRRPFSYLFPVERFPRTVRITDRLGRNVATLAENPLQDKIPVDFDACASGRRDFQWREDQPATIAWAEAQDGGDPAVKVAERDQVFQLSAPFTDQPALVCATRYRFHELTWGQERIAIATDFWWKTRQTRTYLVDPSRATTRLLFERSSEDVYADPGEFVTAPNGFNRPALRCSPDRKRLFLVGEGCGPMGNRPFLDAFSLATGQPERLWQADGAGSYEQILRVLDPIQGRLLTRIQGPDRFPNLYLRSFGKQPGLVPVTQLANPYRALAGVSRRTIHYTRADGVALSAVLHLPAGYDLARDGKLPVLLEAYPTEFKDPRTAGQLKESPYLFSTPYWASPLYFALRGYAVLQGTQFPIVGQGAAEPNDTYIEQLVANAKAAIDEVDRLGVGDPRRVACIGHSYGAFMVANLLAHCDLFAAGIARSGAYNRTLTPFGFQAEERNFWQAQSLYQRMSPFDYANRIKAPLLLIHGDADNNPGTFTLQSERMFQAVKGLGGTARLVLLPLEAHSYAARENILHMLWEEDNWLEKYVKNR